MSTTDTYPPLIGKVVYALIHKTDTRADGMPWFVGGLRTSFYPLRIFKTALPEQIKHFQSFSKAKAFLERADKKNKECKN